MEKEEEGESLRTKLILIVATVVLLVVAVWIEKNCQLAIWQLLLVYLIPYLLVGHETLGEAAEGIMHGEIFDEDFLMSVATIGALGIGFFPGTDNEFMEAVFVMLFFQVGELFEGYAEGKSRDSISHLMDIRPEIAHVEQPDGNAGADGVTKVVTVAPETVGVGDVLVVKPGEKIPLDGIVIEGDTVLNTLALTGESVPRHAHVGDEVVSGCINMTGVVRVQTTKTFGESTVSKIIALVESADKNKSKSEAFITRFARVYTPIVVFAALALAFLPPIFVGNFSLWLSRALIFLVVSCPCALVISVPLTFFGGIGGASRRGILVKGSNYMDALAKVDTVVFDKTGTLTHGEFAVETIHAGDKCGETSKVELDDNIHVGEYSDREKVLLHLAAHAEHFTTHPIGVALRAAFPEEETDGCRVTDVEEIPGYGIRAKVNGKMVCVGNKKMMESVGAKWHECNHVGTIVHVAIDGKYEGHIVINDKIKEGSSEAIAYLKRLGVRKTIMLTGDRKKVAENVAHQLGLDACYAELLPTDKVEKMEQLLALSPDKTLAYVGDGINDAPVLKRADVGIAMGGLGSDAAIEAADIVLMDDDPKKIGDAIKIARHTIRIAHENVTFAIGVKVAVLILASIGLGTMWMAVFADVGVTVLAVLNAMRALSTKSYL